MEYVIRIRTENAAFKERPNGDEIGWILKRLAAALDGVELRAESQPRRLQDTYGNAVGTAGWESDAWKPGAAAILADAMGEVSVVLADAIRKAEHL